jgi:hypothetical protein
MPYTSPHRTDPLASPIHGLSLVDAVRRSAAITEQFRTLKAALERPVAFERRRYGRIALPMPVVITPLDQTGLPLTELTMTVDGKDISPRGVSFFHQQPLPHRQTIVSFDHPEVGHFAMEVDIGWCQFTGSGWYISGGRVIRGVAPMRPTP